MSYYVLGRASFFVANTNSDANKSRTGLSQYLFEHRSHIFPSTIRTSWVGEKFYIQRIGALSAFPTQTLLA